MVAMVEARRDGWLLRDQVVLASVEVARTRRERRRGLAGRDNIDGVLLLPVRWIHTFGMRFPIDAIYLDDDFSVVRLSTIPPSRLAAPCWAARQVLEAPAGAIQEWELHVGDVVEIR